MASSRHELYNLNNDPILQEFRKYHESLDISPEERKMVDSHGQSLFEEGLKILHSEFYFINKIDEKKCRKCFSVAAALGNTAALALLAKVQYADGEWWNKTGTSILFKEIVERNPLKVTLYYRHAIEANYKEISNNPSRKAEIEQANNTLINELTHLALQFQHNEDEIYIPFHAALAIRENRDGNCLELIEHFNYLAMSQPKIFDKLCSVEDTFKINQMLYPDVKIEIDRRNLLPTAIKHGLKTEIFNELARHEEMRQLPNKASALITSFLNPEPQYSEELLEQTAETIRLNNLPLNYPEKIALLDEFKKSDLRTIETKEADLIKDFLKDDSIYNIVDLVQISKWITPKDILIELKNKAFLTEKERQVIGLYCAIDPELGAFEDYLLPENSLSERFLWLLGKILSMDPSDPARIQIANDGISFFKEETEKSPKDASIFLTMVSLYMMNGNSIMEREYLKKSLQKAWQLGDAGAAFWIRAVCTNKRDKVSLLTIAAKKGYWDSLSLLARCYQSGDGVPQDEAFAQACFNLAQEAPTFSEDNSNPGVTYQEALGFLASKAYSNDPEAPELDIDSDAYKAKSKFNMLAQERPEIFCGLLALYKDSLSTMELLLTPENYTNINQRQEEYLSNLSKRETALNEVMAELKIGVRDTEGIITQYASDRNRPLINLSLFNTNSSRADSEESKENDATSSPCGKKA